QNGGAAGSGVGVDLTVSGGTSAGNDTFVFDNALDSEVYTGTVANSDVDFAGTSIGEGAATDSAIQVSEIDLVMADGVNIQSDGAIGATSVLNAAADTAAAQSTYGAADTTAGNNVEAQTLTISGQAESSVEVGANDSAKTIATLVNAVADSTGVSATATTTATLSALDTDGVVSFSLNGSNVSANVTTTDLTNLSDAINDKSGATGVIAKLSLDKASITLEHDTGEDMAISTFDSSAAVDGASGTEVSMTLSGGTGTSDVVLQNGGVNAGTRDSTVVGGEVEFKSTAGYFSVESNTAEGSGGVFQGTAGDLKASANETVSTIDISSVVGSNDAIDIVDGALARVDAIRADLGAVQNRFETTITNLQTSSENLSAARSRIQDTDFAAETAALTRSQILQQAGVAMLAQANSVPQLVLSLLG
ncbi:hypothetical protein BOW53_00605, partial [Solemya pervernicosa gill symbiont]